MKSSAARMVGLGMIALGLVALGLVGSYLGYRAHSRSGLEDLNFNVAEIERLTETGSEPYERETAGSVPGGGDSQQSRAKGSVPGDGDLDERDAAGTSPGGGPDERDVAGSVPGDGGPDERDVARSVPDDGGPDERDVARSVPDDGGPDGHELSGTNLNGRESAETSGDADPGGTDHLESPLEDREVVGDLDATSEDGQVRVSRASSARLAEIYAAVYAGMEMHPKYWHEPLRAATDARVAVGLPEGFEPASAHDSLRFSAPKTEARRLSIPSIGVDSDVKELAVVDLGSSRAYETPKNTIGHIPETADPGELGNGWFFGHLESPFRGEGNVFQRLPEIADLLRQFAEVGEGSVYVVVESDTAEYLYEVVATQVVHADELRLYDTDGVYITLVTCVPRLDYSHRLLVTAKLVGVGI